MVAPPCCTGRRRGGWQSCHGDRLHRQRQLCQPLGGGLYNRGGTTTLTNCTISANSAASFGGGLDNFGSAITLTICTVIGNRAGASGGGLLNNDSTTTLTDCTVSGNSAINGGGLYGFSGTTTLTGSTIVSGNSASNSGGGLFDAGGTTMLNSFASVNGNSAGTDGGGVMTAGGTTTLIDSAVSGNIASQDGGGLYDLDGMTTLVNSTVSGNIASKDGGGLYDSGGTTALANSTTVSDNVASNSGGGLFDAGGTTALTSSSTVSGNSAGTDGGGVVIKGGTTTLTGSTISGNSAVSGGGFYDYAGTTPVTDCTISGNSAAANGGGLANSGCTTTLNNCTVSGNSAITGGGVFNDNSGTTTLTNCTVSGNSAGTGGGIFTGGGTTTLTNTIVAGQVAGGDIAGAVTGSYNLVGTGGSGGLVNDVNVKIVGVASPGLSSLGNYGGPTQTMALLPGSPAIDAGTAGAGILATDQRGALRGPAGLNAGTAVDIGAYEDSSSYLVTSTADSYDVGTLRGGIGWANVSTNASPANIAKPSANLVVFDTAGTFSTPRTITLSPSLGTLELSNAVTAETITGPAAGLIVSGGNAVRVFQVDSEATATFSGLTIADGFSTGNGGGLFNDGGTTTLTDVTLSGNSATGNGGGLYELGGMTVLTDCTVSGNSATENGGGLYNSGGTTTLINCTVSGNSASAGGGLYNEISGTTTLIDCTVSGNSAGTGGGVFNGGGTTTLSNTIVAEQIAGGDIVGAISGSYNLIGTGGSGGLVNGVGGNIVGVGDPGLAPLGYYGGPTQTMALLPGSPAINTGSTALVPAGVTTDQRGFARIVNGVVDIGSFTYLSGPLVVNTTAIGTPGQLDLRGAVGLADVLPGAHAITFDPTVFASVQTITLTSGQLELNNTSGTETIIGPSAGVILSGGGLSRVFQIDSGVTAVLSGLTISGGSALNGGGLYNDGGTTTLTNCNFSGNSASGNGGGLYNESGTTNLTTCVLSGNSAGSGGGLANSGGLMTLTDCTVRGNTAGNDGGGLFNIDGTITLTDCAISGNAATNGGGLYEYGGTTTLTSSTTVSGNSASNDGGGLYDAGGTMMLINSTVSGNAAALGGGLWNGYDSAATTTLTLTSCSVSGNNARLGGGLSSSDYGTTTLTNCTVSGNSATGDGGGLFSTYYGMTTLTNCTVSGNTASSGGGIDSENGTVSIGNTIVAENTAETGGPDALGAFASEGHNLVGDTDGSSGWVGSDLTGNVAQPLNPLLAPLTDFGGPTQTMALLPGSPAIDAGSNALVSAGVTTDQRGLPRIVNHVVDIGAFESSGFTITVTSGSGQSAGVLTLFPAPLVVAVTAKNPSEPVAGGQVRFTPPSSGASATISESPATISSAGKVSVTATANGVVGSYTLSATARGITAPATFGLQNEQLVIALDPSAGGALSLSGNASINIAGVVYVDSKSSIALSASGNANITAAAILVHGGFKKSGNASLSPAPVKGAGVLAVASLPLPSTTGMTNYGSFSLGGDSSRTIKPGIYTSISVAGNAKLTMASGIYIIEGGGFSVSGNASVTGSGVLVFNAGRSVPGTGGTYGSITLGGNGACSLSPMMSGPYAGIVFFQPSDNRQAMTVTCNASGVSGTVYAPGAGISERSNGEINGSLIVDTLRISGNGVTGPGPTTNKNLVAAVLDQATPNMSAGTIPIAQTIKVTDASGSNVRSSRLPTVSMSAVGSASHLVPQPAPGSQPAGIVFTFDVTNGINRFNLKTKGTGRPAPRHGGIGQERA